MSGPAGRRPEGLPPGALTAGHGLAGALAAGAAAIHAAVMPVHLIDDAYISFRYAANLAGGHGLVFNLGHRVEGISNPLWTVVLAGASGLGLSLPGTAWVLDVAAVAALAALTVVLAGRLGLGPVAAGAAGLAVAGTGDLVAAGTLGLETPLYACLLVVAVMTCLPGGSRRRGPAFALSVLALALCRPEGLLLGGLLVLLRWAWRRRLDGGLVAGAAGLALVEVARRAYFGAWVPNTVTAKRDIGYGLVSSLREHGSVGANYLMFGLGARTVVVVVALGLGVVAVRRGGRSLPGPLVPLALVVAGETAVILIGGGDWMPYSRLLAPLLPLIVVGSLTLVAAGAGAVVPSAGARGISVAVAGVAGIMVLVQPVAVRGYFRHTVLAPHPFAFVDDRLGGLLVELHPQPALIAAGQLGRIGYAARPIPVTDVLGLTEPVVAHHHGRATPFGKLDLHYTAGEHPDLFLDSNPSTLAGFVAVSPDRWLAVSGSAALDGVDRLLLLRSDQVPIGQAITAAFGGQLVPADQVLPVWRRRWTG